MTDKTYDVFIHLNTLEVHLVESQGLDLENMQCVGTFSHECIQEGVENNLRLEQLLKVHVLEPAGLDLSKPIIKIT